MNQQTLTKSYKFEGRGLHTGKYAHLTLNPAPADYGIRFVRTDRGVEVPAIASKITRTDRSTTISEGDVSVITIEHLMSALTGLGVDNARIEIDNEEVPILDGSAERYVRAIAPDGLLEQDAERLAGVRRGVRGARREVGFLGPRGRLPTGCPSRSRSISTPACSACRRPIGPKTPTTPDRSPLPHLRLLPRTGVPGRARSGQGRRRGQRHRDRGASRSARSRSRTCAGSSASRICP